MEYLTTYKRMAEGVAALMFPHVEAVVHDLDSGTIAYMANNYSNREVGGPSLVEDVDVNDEKGIIGPYRKVNWDGKVLKSISIILKNSKGHPEALLCINVDMTEMERMHKILGLMLEAPREDHAAEVIFREDWYERINVSIQSWLHERKRSLQGLSRGEKRELVLVLASQGAFKGQGSVPYVARCLGLGRATVYKYLGEEEKTNSGKRDV